MLRYLRDLAGPVVRPALFLDRDGVLNRHIVGGYVTRPEDLEVIDVALDAISWARHRGAAVVVVTNQGAIGRGLATEGDIAVVHAVLIDTLAQRGAVIDAIYACPHHPDAVAPGDRVCACRKPKPGMILQAAHDLHLDLARSILVGDQAPDVEAAQAAGITGERAVLLSESNRSDLSAEVARIAAGHAWPRPGDSPIR
jgi:D-glycero-D-manno-heptose 1,7-bisphosphate phosphatase